MDTIKECADPTCVPEVQEAANKEQEKRVVEEGTAIWKQKKEECLRQKQREQRELREILENYSPWGKPGGGAPCTATLRKKNVPLEPPELVGAQFWPWGRPGPGGVPWRDPKLLGVRFLESMGWTDNSTIQKLHNGKINPLAVVDMNKFYDDKAEAGIATDLPPLRESRNLSNKEAQAYRLTGGVELVPLLTCKRCQSQLQMTRYHSTDVTRREPSSLQSLKIGRQSYVAELAEQVRCKRDKSSEERRIDEENCRRHFDTWRKFWGKPGHGAPMDHVHRSNLYNILYRPAVH